MAATAAPECATMLPKTSASAAADINIGKKALGLLLTKRTESGY